MIRWTAAVAALLLAAACSNGGSTGDGGTQTPVTPIIWPEGPAADPSARVVEGPWSGMVSRGGVECRGDRAAVRAGTTIHISPGGSDAHDGLTPDTPLATLREGLCNLGPGQTALLLPGTWHESVMLYGFSSVTIRGEAGGDGRLPVMDGSGILTFGIGVASSTGVTVEGLRFVNHTDEGMLAIHSGGTVVKNSEFAANGTASVNGDYHGEGFGIAWSDNSGGSIEGNTVTGNGPGPARRASGAAGTGINTFNCSGLTIADNRVTGTVGGGILVEDGTGVTVTGNAVTGNDADIMDQSWWDAGIWLDGGNGVTVTGNTITGNKGPAVQVSDADRQYPRATKGYVVTGNTITGNYWGLYTMNFGVCPVPGADVLTWSGNTVTGNAYPGHAVEAAEWENDPVAQTLCNRWPCGGGAC